jgi:hypothetical protein
MSLVFIGLSPRQLHPVARQILVIVAALSSKKQSWPSILPGSGAE